MTHLEFRSIMLSRIRKIQDTLDAKGKEYASDDDRLHNFKQAAMLLDGKAPMALLGMLVKHWVSIQDIIRNVQQKDVWPAPALVDEKIGDAINYLILLEALLLETRP
jgi:hypothetical protein